LGISIPTIGVYDVVCNDTELEKYLIPPQEYNVTITDISDGLCHLNSTKSVDLIVLFVEEVNIEQFLRAVLVVFF
jgi:hypothetical protein